MSAHSKSAIPVNYLLFYYIFKVIFCFSAFLDIPVSENRGEFLEKLQRARAQVKPNTPSQPILSHPGPSRLVVGNWALASRKEGELHIHNSDGQQVKNNLYHLILHQFPVLFFFLCSLHFSLCKLFFLSY